MKVKTVCMLMVVCLLANPISIFAEEITDQTKVNTEQEQQKPNLTIKDAIDKGLSNSIDLQKVKNQAQIAQLTEDNAKDTKTTIGNADTDLYDAENKLLRGSSDVYNSMNMLDSAQVALNNGMAPQAIPIQNPETGEVVVTIPKGANIQEFLTAIGQGGLASSVIAGVQATLDNQRLQLNQGMANLDTSTRTYYGEKAKFDTSMGVAMANISNKLGLSTISSLDPVPMSDLITVMARESNKVTSYSYDVYKNQIALLIQKSYYDALKEQKLIVVKKGAMDMAKVQVDFATASYDLGAKSKDDMLMAKTYYNGTVIAYNLELNNYNKAILGLCKNMGVSLDNNYILEDVPVSTHQVYDLTKGIESALSTNLDLKICAAQKAMYNQLAQSVKDSGYDSGDNQYKEALLLQQKVALEEKNTKKNVETSVRESYDTMVKLQKSLENTTEMLENAKECLDIAQYKYEAGFGADNAALASLNLQSLSGTIMEVIAAQQTLSSIQEQIIELTNNYNLAKEKYTNDIGILPY